jgi:hypothetical protein
VLLLQNGCAGCASSGPNIAVFTAAVLLPKIGKVLDASSAIADHSLLCACRTGPRVVTTEKKVCHVIYASESSSLRTGRACRLALGNMCGMGHMHGVCPAVAVKVSAAPLTSRTSTQPLDLCAQHVCLAMYAPRQDKRKTVGEARSTFMSAMSDAGLKPTVVYHNLSPAVLYEKVRAACDEVLVLSASYSNAAKKGLAAAYDAALSTLAGGAARHDCQPPRGDLKAVRQRAIRPTSTGVSPFTCL